MSDFTKKSVYLNYMRGETPIGTPPFSVAEQKADFSRRGYPPPYSVDDGEGVGG